MAKATQERGRAAAGGGPRTASSGPMVKVTKASLSPEDRRVVDEIADQVQSWAETMEEGRRLICQRVLREVFDDDAKSMASSDRLRNAKHRYLLQRIRKDGALPVPSFSTFLRVAAYDALVPGPSWKRLDYSIKRRLLQLVSPEAPTSAASLARLKVAAGHAFSKELDTVGADAYVDSGLAELGRTRALRAGPGTYDGNLESSLRFFDGSAGTTRLVHVADRMSASDVQKLEKKLERAAQALLAAAKKIKGRGTKK